MRLVYVHGINQIDTSPESAKLTWDLDLFGRENPESRLVYWGDLSVVQEMRMGLSFKDMILCEILKIGTANHLLKDVHNYFYKEEMRFEILKRFKKALPDDPNQPCVVLSHSLGSVIAYDGLIRKEIQHSCKNLITIGSPLGLETVMAEMRRLTGGSQLLVPPKIKKWSNFRDRIDPVSLGKSVNGKYKGSPAPIDNFLTNLHEQQNPHSLSGYLQTRVIRNEVAEALLL